MKKFYLLTTLVFSFALFASPTVSADDHEENSFYLSISELSVKLGHTDAFMEGVKAVRACYQEAGSKEPWSIWHRVQGPGTVFVVTSTYKNWQGFFAENEVGETCRSVVHDEIVPHIDSTYHQMASFMPDWSNIESPSGNFVAVFNFKVSDYELFEATVTAVEEGLKDDGGPGAAWYYVVGGRDQADFFVVEYFADPAALDADDPGVWKRLEAAVGKEKADKLRHDFRASVSEWWSYMYALHEDLSYTPSTSK
ncbi:hypothetical protein ACFOD1_07515 [Pseudidiomarina halophila]|uniref:NIPSNAP domain-containing protein n=1 Tax=Pseudidiomarina halophila TaxID=1449799 RepID=A0A432XRG8_9GAMM|nr:hypothetical protein [Pseudidiomarina halophila]RUO51253.1 hypothetical protein CWI69_12050 [Pseudidiomarina halophila]